MDRAEQIQRTKDETHMVNANPKRNDLPIGSWILVEYHSSIIRRGPPNKLNMFLRGPFKVSKRELDHYSFWNSVTKIEETVHASEVHPFLFDANFIDPSDIALKDAISTFNVERILEHVGDKRRVSSMEFKVRWEGFDASKDLWLPWKELIHNSKLHAYLFAHNMKALIHKDHRKGIYR